MYAAIDDDRWLVETLTGVMPPLVWIYDADLDEVAYISDESAFEELWGLSTEDVLETPAAIREEIHPEDRPAFAETVQSVLEGEQSSIEVRINSDADYSRWVRIELEPVSEGGTTTHLAGFVREITEEKQRRKRLRIREHVIEASPTAIAIADLDGVLTSVNSAFLDAWGFDSESEVVGRSVTDFWADPEAAATVAETVATEGDWRGDLLAVRSDGSTFHAHCVAGIVTDDGGDPIALMSSFVDVTDRTEYEQRLRDQRDMLELLNEILSHDIRNDLQVISGVAELLTDHVDADGRDRLDTVLQTADHAVELTTITREIADIMLADETDQQQLNCRRLLLEEVQTVRSAFPDATVAVDGSIPDEPVRANKAVDSVFRNLLRNALQHNDKDEPEVRVSAAECEELIEVRVADNGPGIADDRKADVFGKGEKSADSDGSGLGLHLVRTFVEQYDGSVRIEDNEPEGTVVSVELRKAE